MAIKCMKCGAAVYKAKTIKKYPTKVASPGIGVCYDCYDKREKWLKGAGKKYANLRKGDV